jgi:hypothetical protein
MVWRSCRRDIEMRPDLFESLSNKLSHSGWMSYGVPNEALSGCRRTESSTLMNLHIETHLYLHSNNDMYMWNQVNCTKNHYANVGTSSPYKQWSYPMVSCPHHHIYRQTMFCSIIIDHVRNLGIIRHILT